MKIRRTVSLSLLLIVAATLTWSTRAAETGSTSSGRFLELDGIKLFYEVRGQGQPIVFLHDGLLHSESWASQWDFFATDHKVIRYDRRGYGKSDPPVRPYSDVADLHSLLQHLNVSNAVLFACSAGGGLALDFALQYPDKVNRLLLVGPIVSGFGFSVHFHNRNRAAFTPLRETNISATVSNWLKDPWLIASDNKQAKERFRQLLSANPQNLTRPGRFQKPPERPALPRLCELMIPTLILVGEFDIPDVHAHCGAIQAGIADSRRLVVPGTGHLIFLEKPDEFNRLAASFLSSPSKDK